MLKNTGGVIIVKKVYVYIACNHDPVMHPGPFWRPDSGSIANEKKPFSEPAEPAQSGSSNNEVICYYK